MINDWRVSVAYRLFGTGSGYRLMSFVGFLSVSDLALAVAVLVTVLGAASAVATVLGTTNATATETSTTVLETVVETL